MAGIFSGLNDRQESSDRYGYMQPGRYVVRLNLCKDGEDRKTKVGYFVAEIDILKSNNPDIKPGERRSWYQKLLRDTPSYDNLAQFIAVASGVDPKEVDEAAAELVVSDDQPLKGTVLNLTCSTITTKAGNPFTKHTWEPCALSAEEIAALTKAAGL